ncbi:MAG: chemotaxis protein CheA [Sulfuritalea sp.]|jgi:two-component system chemotaxis sensor kinase CheA|nr:chemotaxis protein CheA [Sulfuritalea sp.]
MNLDDALQTFIVEAGELLEQMEEALLRIEQTPDDADTINAIFRAAHTIKGSAGLFGFDHVVAFTHVAESVLDRVRSDELRITSELVAIFLSVRDHLGALIAHIADGKEPDDDTHRTSAELVTKLRVYLGPPAPASSQALVPAKQNGTVETQAGDGVGTDNWHISLRFAPDVLRNGMDPLSFIRYLTTFGKIVHIVTVVDAVPRLAELDPEASYLGYEVAFHTDADKTAIEGAFEFVRNDARIRILPPHAKVADYKRLIDELPQEELRLGEILILCGTLTRTELNAALSHQTALADETLSPIGEVLVDQKLVQPQVVAAALEKQKQVKEHKATESGLIRVNAEKLDVHINLIGELIIASAGASLIAQHTAMPELLEASARLSRLVEEVRDSALTLRMVEIGATFNRFQRVVRDVSVDLGKDIRLEISGADTDLDKTVVEKIGDPLTHLVRNSMDHGIEPVEVRLASGKPAHGTVRLNAYHDSGSIVIEVADDGGGLSRERILAKAIERGLAKPDQQLSDQEIHELIFEPGFSTVEKVSNLSGRGVGMDVVKRNITALRGTVEIDSTEGVGTTMRIRLPLTLAIIDGFLVGVGGSTFVVPLDMVVECVELSAEETAASQGRDHLDLRGEVLPFIRLKQLFDIPDPPPADIDFAADDTFDNSNAPQRSGLPSTLLTAEGAAALARDPELAFLLHPVKRENVVVVQYAGRRTGLVVDELMGEFQTVIRPLGEVFSGIDGISGFTILGSGNVALILDVPGLVRRVAGREGRRNIQATTYAMAE